jgi:hypothetical protein
MALEDWQVKALEYDLLDYNTWAAHAVQEDIYPDDETALIDKANKSAKRMITSCESIHGKFDPSKTVEEKVLLAYAKPDYKNRQQRDAEGLKAK